MIKVRFVGGAKKSFSTDELELDYDGITIETLLAKLVELKPENTPDLDTRNVLIAINGVDSSAREGLETKITKDDLVSIIPVIHGGSPKKILIPEGKKSIQILEIKGGKNTGVPFLESLREEFSQLKLQAISSNFILNLYHLKKILSISLLSEKEKILLSNKIETDILMRFAASGQISQAIATAGIKPKKNFILIAIGNKTNLEKLYQKLKPLCIEIFSKDNSSFLKKHFKITKIQLDTIYSKNPLEDLLIEKAAILL